MNNVLGRDDVGEGPVSTAATQTPIALLRRFVVWIQSQLSSGRSSATTRVLGAPYQFTLATWLIAACGIAVAIIAFLNSFHWVTIGLLELLCLWIGTNLLSGHLPRAIRKTVVANCFRSDGSWSERRTKIERRGVQAARQEIFLALLFAAAATNVLLILFDQTVMPLSIGMRLIHEVPFLDGDVHQLRHTEGEYADWLGDRAHSQQPSGWILQTIPTIAVGACLWGIVCVALLHSAYLRALRRLAAHANLRANRYRLASMARWHDEAQFALEMESNEDQQQTSSLHST